MSYDVTFHYPGTTYPADVWRNYTSNVSGMWTKALGGTISLGELIDQKGERNADLIPHLAAAIARMTANPDEYRAMNPANGWGDYEGALAFLEWMLAMCEAVPEGNVDVWR